MAKNNDALLKEIRERYEYHCNYWRDIWEEGRKDVKSLSGDPWEPEERALRQPRNGPKRPTLSLDELHQYTNQIVNDIRINKRAIRITPEGEGADEEHGERRQNRIRQIEYKSNAQTIYTMAYQGAVERSYGYAGVLKRYLDDEGFDQELILRGFPNPDAVSLDPDCKQADCSDMRDAFVIDRMPVKEFKRRFPKAEIKDFTGDHFSLASQWITEETVQVAEYWKIKSTYRKRLLVRDPQSGQEIQIWQDELPKGIPIEVLREREVEQPQVIQYITNGVEILDEIPWEGKWIPIVPVFGKEMYVSNGSGSKRMLFSAVRLARDPFMLYCYYRSCQAEFAGMIPKVPAVGYKGQFEGVEDEWNTAHKVPRGYLEAHGLTGPTGQTVLPLPTTKQWDATPLSMMDQVAESARRAIQAAMGQTPLPTAAQRQNQKSGIALERIESSQTKGSYHFVDNFDRFLAQMGRILDDMLTKIEDTPRDVGLRKPDDSYEVIRLHEQTPGKNGGGPEQPKTYGNGRYTVTVSTGPSHESQRSEAGEFVGSIAENQQLFPMAIQGNAVAAKVVALAIKLKKLGPLGDQMAEAIDPQQKGEQQAIPPQVQQQMKQMQEQTQQLQQENGQLQAEKQSRELEWDTKERIAALQAQVDVIKIRADATKALAALESKEAVELLSADLQRTDLMIAQMMQPGPAIQPQDQPPEQPRQ